MRREGGKVDFKLAFQLHLQLEERAIQFLRLDLAIDAGYLPKDRLIRLGVGTQHLRIHAARAVKQNMQANLADLSANLVDDVLGAPAVMRRDHHMGDPKVAIGRQRRAQARFRQPLRPELTGYVGHDADAVALAIHITGAVAHAGERFDCPLDVAMRRLPAFAHRTNQGTGVAVVPINWVKIGEGMVAWQIVYTRHISPLE